MDRIWGIWGSYFSIPQAIFYLFKGDYSFVWSLERLLGSMVEGLSGGFRVYG